MSRIGSTEVEAQQEFLARVQEIAGRVQYREETYEFEVDIDRADPDGRVFVQLLHERPDANTGVLSQGAGGKRYLSPHMTDSEVVRTMFGAAVAYEEHEVREFFRYRPAGSSKEIRQVFGPHIDTDSLWLVANQLDVRG